MTLLIDFLNDDIATIKAKFSQIQNRYLDPYSISITTETNKQIFFSEYLNNFTKTFLGTNNEVLNGLLASIQEETDTYLDIYVTKGAAIVDSVLI